MNKLIFVIFGSFIVWSCESQKEDKLRLGLLKNVYDEKWGLCNRSIYAQTKSIRDNGSKEIEMQVLNESVLYRDSTLQYLERGQITQAKTLLTKGLVAKKLNAGNLVRQMALLDSAYVSHKDSTSLLYAQISIVNGLFQLLNDNSAQLGSSY